MGIRGFWNDHFVKDKKSSEPVVDRLDDSADDQEETGNVFADDNDGYDDDVNYSSGYGAPKYERYRTEDEEREEPSPRNSYQASNHSNKSKSKIYSMNDISRPKAKCKLIYIILNDMNDSINVVENFKNKDRVIIVNFSKLNESQVKRATDFIDGAKHVTGIVFKKITEDIFLYFPDSIEISGEFYDQVDVGFDTY